MIGSLNPRAIVPTGVRRLMQWSAISCIGLSMGYWAIGRHAPVAGSALMAQTRSPEPEAALTRPTLKSGSRGVEVTELQATLKLLGFYNGTVDGVYGQGTIAAVSLFQQAAGLTADGVVGPATWNRLFPPTSPVLSQSSAPATTTPPVVDSADAFPVPSGSKPRPTGTDSRPATSPGSKPATGQPRTAATTPDPVTFPVLRVGMKGPAVSGLQERLQAIGVYNGAVDGVFGPETQAAVKAAQRRLGLEPDGVVGPATWVALLRRSQ